MAVRTDTSGSIGRGSFHPGSMSFQRRSDQTLRRTPRRRRIRLLQTLIFYGLVCLLFWGVQKAAFFLSNWDSLNVRLVRIQCADPAIYSQVAEILRNRPLGNLILLDLDSIRNEIGRHPLIKDLQIRKIFPSSLGIDISIRRPAALISLDRIFLIDREGVIIREAAEGDAEIHPLLLDSNGFPEGYLEKLDRFWTCLDAADEELKRNTASLTLQGLDKVIVGLRDRETHVIVDGPLFAEQMREYLRLRSELENHGELDTVDMRFADRVYIKKSPDSSGQTAVKGVN